MTATWLAVDAMSGDLGPRVIVPACFAALRRHPSLSLLLVGDPEQLAPLIGSAEPALIQRLKIESASEVIAMDDPPARMLRDKPDASMRIALQLVSSGRATGCVSAGNTGALMALARQVLGVLPGVERPAIMTSLPTQTGPVHVLDVGANVDCTAAQLVQFALMGSLAVELADNQQPDVALLNVGAESIKGGQQVRQAAAMLEQQVEIRYSGYIEADAVFRGEAGVIVCDGFVGNVLLKSAEGTARLMAGQLRERLTVNLWRRVLAGLNRGLWRELAAHWSPDAYNGAMLLGVDGLVIKSHGAAGEVAFAAALERALVLAAENLPQRLGQRMASLPAL